MATKITYNGTDIAVLENGKRATLPTHNKMMASDLVVTVEHGGNSSNSPIPEVSTVSEMNAILANATEADVGKAYLYTGDTTETYINGVVYVLVDENGNSGGGSDSGNQPIRVWIVDSYYEITEGMTWREFVDEHADQGFCIENDSTGTYSEDTEIVTCGAPVVYDNSDGGGICLPSDTININYIYRLW